MIEPILGLVNPFFIIASALSLLSAQLIYKENIDSQVFTKPL